MVYDLAGIFVVSRTSQEKEPKRLKLLCHSFAFDLYTTHLLRCLFLLQGEHSDDYGGPYREAMSDAVTELCSPGLPLLVASANGRDGAGLNRDKMLPVPSSVSPLQLQVRTMSKIDQLFPFIIEFSVSTLVLIPLGLGVFWQTHGHIHAYPISVGFSTAVDCMETTGWRINILG